jgi:hypothetical protein
MPLVTRAQLGVKSEAGYGTVTAVDRFYEFTAETVQEQRGRIESAGLRPGYPVAAKDRFVPYPLGAAGDLTMEVLSKGFGWWLEHMLGSVSTTGPDDSVYVHTATIGELTGKSFTAQLNKPFYGGGDNPFTYAGGKVAGWELSNSVDGLLMARMTCDFQQRVEGVSLAEAQYPAGTVELLSFVGGSVELDDVSFPVTNAVLSQANVLKTDRRYLRSSPLKKEPVQNGWRTIAWQLAADFESRTTYDRYVSDTAAGALARIELLWQAQTVAGSSAYPALRITIDEARFDGNDVQIGGPEELTQAISGVGMYDGSTSAVTVEYTSTDTAP